MPYESIAPLWIGLLGGVAAGAGFCFYVTGESHKFFWATLGWAGALLLLVVLFFLMGQDIEHNKQERLLHSNDSSERPRP